MIRARPSFGDDLYVARARPTRVAFGVDLIQRPSNVETVTVLQPKRIQAD